MRTSPEESNVGRTAAVSLTHNAKGIPLCLFTSPLPPPAALRVHGRRSCTAAKQFQHPSRLFPLLCDTCTLAPLRLKCTRSFVVPSVEHIRLATSAQFPISFCDISMRRYYPVTGNSSALVVWQRLHACVICTFQPELDQWVCRADQSLGSSVCKQREGL